MFLNSVIPKEDLGFNSKFLDRHDSPSLAKLHFCMKPTTVFVLWVQSWVQSFCNFCTFSWIFACVDVKSNHIDSSCIRNFKNCYVPFVWLARIIVFKFQSAFKWAAPFIKSQIHTTFIASFKILSTMSRNGLTLNNLSWRCWLCRRSKVESDTCKFKIML